MAERPNLRARSLYRGIRATVTEAPDGSAAWLSLSFKRTDSHWSEWDTITPALRIDLGEVSDVRHALVALAEAIITAADDLP